MKSIYRALMSLLVALAEITHAKLFNYMASSGLAPCVVSLPNGSLVAIAASYGASKVMSALSNANPPIATLESSHGVVSGDILEVTSGWSRLTDKIVRATGPGSPATINDISFEGIDTSLTSVYPAGSGTGTVREILTWTQLSQILTSNSSGGEQQFTEYQFLEADAKKRIPTAKNPSGISFSIADDPNLAGYQLASIANDDRLQRAVRITLPSGALIFYNAYISLNKTPTLTVNEIMAVEVTLSLLAEPVRYAS